MTKRKDEVEAVIPSTIPAEQKEMLDEFEDLANESKKTALPEQTPKEEDAALQTVLRSAKVTMVRGSTTRTVSIDEAVQLLKSGEGWVVA